MRGESPFAVCQNSSNSASCEELFGELINPYFINAQANLTQTSGWIDAWISEPSAYIVAAKQTEDVVTAVNFARQHHLRLVVKGGGHSYHGTSNTADSLLIWTRDMNTITLHDAFVAEGCADSQSPQPAVTVEAGAIWMSIYHAVTTQTGRYVQGGGCTTVGVAGLIQSGGFGSFSKNFGTAASGLLQAEIVTSDGVVRIANACTHPDLFWSIKGGGGGSLGVVTKLTLKTHDLPNFFGGVFLTINASSDAAFRQLIAEFIRFYHNSLFNPHWGEQAIFRPDNTLNIEMVFQGLTQEQAEAVWQPFLDWVTRSPQEFTIPTPPRIVTAPARHFWNPEYLRENVPDLIVTDDRPGASENNIFWAGNQGEAGFFLHGYHSTWLPSALLGEDQRSRLVDALFATTRHWRIALHFNKGLAGAPADVTAAARDTAMNPVVLNAFALAITAGGEPPAYPGVPGHEPDWETARNAARAIDQAMGEMQRLVPNGGSYVSESNFFGSTWQQDYWGTNYPQLQAVKQKYDPEGLFFVHHGVGSEEWSADGFTRLA